MNCYLLKGTRKGLMIAIAAVAVGLGAGVAVLWATGDVKADSGLSPGFIKGTNPAKPDPKMIEEGKKIYFRKCVWRQGHHPLHPPRGTRHTCGNKSSCLLQSSLGQAWQGWSL